MAHRRLRPGQERPLPSFVIVDNRSTGRRPLAELPRQFDGGAFVRPPADALPHFAPWQGPG
jgi:hypothetical protein